MIFIGCDVGTSSTKAVAVDEKGRILAQGSKSYGIVQPHTNWAEQDPDLWLDGAVSSIRDVISQVDESEIKGICISALYGGTGALCDSDFRPVRPALIWMDRRAEEESRSVRETIGEDEIFRVTNNGIDSYFGYIKLLWVKHHEPENWQKIRWALPANTYITFKITGQLAVDYSSAGNFGGVYDYSQRCWSKYMCEKFGFDPEIFPDRLCNGFETIGEVNESYRKIWGLSHSVPVCAGTIDCIASMLSAGAFSEGDNAAVLGTSLNWGTIHRGLSSKPGIVSMPYVIKSGEYSYSYGGASTAGALPRWFVNRFMGADSAENYSQIEDEVLKAGIGPGSDGLVILPYFMGERTPIWDEKATGVFFGITLAHTRAHVYHAILESVAYSLNDIMDTMTFEKPVDRIVLVGGGSKSKLWPQIFADVTGKEVLIPENPVEAPLGDAFMAAYAAGAKEDFGQMRSWLQFREPVRPGKQSHLQYQKWFALYRKLYRDLKNDMAERAEQIKG